MIPMLSRALVLLLSSLRAAAPAAVEAAVEKALPEGARAEVSLFQAALPRDCVLAAATVEGTVTGSARITLKLAGNDGKGQRCEGAGTAFVRVFAPVPVAARTIRTGESFEGAVGYELRELRPGHAAAAITAGATAARTIASGSAIEAGACRLGPAPGSPVKVVVQMNGLAVSDSGRVVPCAGLRVCAVLPSGRHVAGRFAEGTLVVETTP